MSTRWASAVFAGFCGTAALLLSGCEFPELKPPPVTPGAGNGKIAIALAPIPNVRIELPDESFHDFGEDLQARLTTQLTESGRYIVVDENAHPLQEQARSMLAGDDDEYHWSGSITPIATIRVKTEELSFVTGAQGGRMFYGFDRHFKTPYNDGTQALKNEFPLRSVTFEPNWFDRAFDRKGSEAFGSQSGLDLGEGFELNVLFAYFLIKYARYETSVGLNVEIDAPLAQRHEFREIDVKGKGFFYDVVGGYLQYSGGIRVARTDAMDQAMKNAFDGSFQAVNRGLSDLPLVAKVDGIVHPGDGKPELILLGTGPYSEVKKGTVYSAVSDSSIRIVVDQSVASGSIGHLMSGEISRIQPGLLLRESGFNAPKPPGSEEAGRRLALSSATSLADSVDLPDTNLPPSDLSAWVPEISKGEAVAKSIAGVFTLTYRAWRYHHYDQSFKDSLAPETDGVASASVSDPDDWSAKAKKETWAKQIGLDQAGEMEDLGLKAPLIAVLDSGVDYNDNALNSRIWWNLSPQYGDEHGYDFISGDSNPYDDAYHGTEVASAALAVAPRSRIMPVKIFNPWGITSSAAIYAGFQYAVDHGASIILAGWATRKYAQAIEQGVAYAQKNNVLVVTAAGDRGEFLPDHPVYPGNLAKTYDNVLNVTGVTLEDQRVDVKGKAANFGSNLIQIAAPGKDIRVAEPRNGTSRETGTGIAAGLVAGAVARNLARDHFADPSPAGWIAELLSQADRIGAIDSCVRDGYRLRIAE